MTSLLFLAAAWQGGATPPPAQEPAKALPDPVLVLRDVSEKLASSEAVKGKFQLSILKDPVQNGEFKLQKPAQFAITGVELEQYYDGKTFIQYDKVGKVFDRRSPHRFEKLEYLTGYESFFGLVSPLEPIGIKPVALFRQDMWAIELKPQTADVVSYRVFVDPQTMAPRGWSINHKDGRQMSLKISEVVFEPKLTPGDFYFEPPKDARSMQQVSLTESLLDIGFQIPNFAANRTDDKVFKFYDYLQRTKGTVVFFWYADCEACKAAIPSLREFMVPLAKQGLGAIAVNVGDNPGIANARLKEWKLDLPCLRAEPDSVFVKTFKVAAYPTIYLVGPDGKVWMRSVGLDVPSLKAGLKGLGFKP